MAGYDRRYYKPQSAHLGSDDEIREHARERAERVGAPQLYKRTKTPEGWVHHYVNGTGREARVWAGSY